MPGGYSDADKSHGKVDSEIRQMNGDERLLLIDIIHIAYHLYQLEVMVALLCAKICIQIRQARRLWRRGKEGIRDSSPFYTRDSEI